MSGKRARVLGVVTAALALGAADPLPKLPQPAKLPQSGDSPGLVVFDHSSHVDTGRPDCTTCHSKIFPILERKGGAPLKHEQMTKGQACGACHDGKKAFGFEDDCSACHRS